MMLKKRAGDSESQGNTGKDSTTSLSETEANMWRTVLSTGRTSIGTVIPCGWFPLPQTVWQFEQTSCTPSRVGVASFLATECEPILPLRGQWFHYFNFGFCPFVFPENINVPFSKCQVLETNMLRSRVRVSLISLDRVKKFPQQR